MSEPAGASLRTIVAQSTALVFVGYLGIGLEAPVVPAFVHRVLGLSATLARVALDSQALDTLPLPAASQTGSARRRRSCAACC